MHFYCFFILSIVIFVDVDRDNLLPPIQTVQILSQKKTLTIGLVRDYIISRLDQIDRVTMEVAKHVFACMWDVECVCACVRVRTCASVCARMCVRAGVC